MNNVTTSLTILAIESAIDGGSMSVIQDGVEISAIFDGTVVSKAEAILVHVQELFEMAGVRLSEVDRIVVSSGPGSYTGIRIGMATAKGLARSLGIEVFEIPVLAAMSIAKPHRARVVTAVPFGKADVAWQEFSANEKKEWSGGVQRATSIHSFQEYVASLKDVEIIAHSRICDFFISLDFSLDRGVKLIDTGQNLARLLGLASLSGRIITESRPIYLQNPARNRNLT